MKQDHHLDGNDLKGAAGDKMTAILAACGFSLRKLLRTFFWLTFKELKPLEWLLLPSRWDVRQPMAKNRSFDSSLLVPVGRCLRSKIEFFRDD
ncbi:MAG TPA: hypothetical protein VD811_10945 [Desulfuromonadales bacterium]|nr:hypothetical protein [Desulfuromonadales bacterium]